MDNKPAMRWYQEDTVKYILDKRHAYLNLYMGLGKTRCCIEAMNDSHAKKVLVICPKAVIDTWSEEYSIWGNGTIKIITNDIKLSYNVTQLADELKRRIRFSESFMIVVNFAKLVEKKNVVNQLTELLYSIDWDVIVVDEAHKIKQHNGSASLTCRKLGLSNKDAIKIAQSGTPLPHSPMDVFSQYRFLDETIFGDSYNTFKRRWFMTNEYNAFIAIFDQEKFKEKVHSRMISFEEGLVKLPETMHQKISIELEDKAQKIYKSIEDNFYVQLEKGELSVNIALTKLLRLSQTTGGYLPTDDGQLERVSQAKAKAVGEILDGIDINEPVVIFYRFETDKTQLKEVIEGRVIYELSGKCDELQKWKNATGGEVLIVQIQSGNAGVSFTRSMYCIYYSIGYSAGDLEQSMKRQHRSGQERNVMYYHILCKNTIDIDIYNAIFKKMKTARDILNTTNADAELLMALLNKRKESKCG